MIRRRWLLVVVLLVQVMVALDVSVVNVALPDIQSSLGFSAGGLTWVINAYALTFGGLLMLGGRVGDVVGRRPALLAGLALFAAASLAGGLAQTPGQLIAARAVQGVGAAVLAPIAFTLLAVHIPAGPARARALGLWGAAAAVGGALGVLIGGLCTESIGWRTVLLLNLPIVAFALVAAVYRIPVDRRDGLGPRLDPAGAVLVTAGMSTLVLGVIRTDTHPWGSATTVLTLLLAVALLVAFVFVEFRVAAPLLRIGLLAQRPVAAANLFVLLLFSGQFAAFYFVSLYLQRVLGYGPAETGVAFLPFTAGLVLGAGVASRAVGRIGERRLLVTGGVLAAVGFVWFAVTMSADGSFLTAVLGPSLVVSVGVGLSVVPVATAATTGVAAAEAGMASSLITSSRQLGGALGLAALATVATTVTGHDPDRAALAHGYASAIGVSAALLAVAALIALVLLPARASTRPASDSAPAPSDANPPAVTTAR